MNEREIIKQIKEFKKIQPNEKWVVFCRQKIENEISKLNKQIAEKLVLEEQLTLNNFIDKFRTRFRIPLFKPAMLTAAILLFVALGVVAVIASKDSLPGDILYPLKITTEKAEMTLTLDETRKAQLDAENTQRRAQELAIILNQDTPEKSERLKKAVEQIEQQLTATQQNSLVKLKEGLDGDQDKILEIAKAVKESTEKVEQTLTQAEEKIKGISEKQTITTKISDISEKLEKTKTEISEIIETVVQSTNDNNDKKENDKVTQAATSTIINDSDISETTSTTLNVFPK